MACKAHDIARGVMTILQLLELDQINKDCTDGDGNPVAPLLPILSHSNLLRLAITSLDMLAGEAEHVTDRWNQSVDQSKAGGAQ
jgi:hypothetical protein